MLPETGKQWTDKNNGFTVQDGVMEVKCFNGTYAILYSFKAVENLVRNHLVPMNWLFDWHLSFLSFDEDIKIYGLVHPLVVRGGDWKIENDNISYKYNVDEKLVFKSETNNIVGGKSSIGCRYDELDENIASDDSIIDVLKGGMKTKIRNYDTRTHFIKINYTC